MYGVNSEVAKRMERRLREKIYREMVEEKELYQKKMEAETKNLKEYHPRMHTDSSYNDTRNSNRKWSRETPTRNLQQHSTFLPVLNHKRTIVPADPYNQSNYSQPYQQYLNRRKDQPETIDRTKSRYDEYNHLEEKSDQSLDLTEAKNNQDENNEQKTLLYLQQCEQIISNLKELTGKGIRKTKPKQTKYDLEQTFNRKKPEISKQFKIEKGFSERTKAMTPKNMDRLGQSPKSLFFPRQKTQSYSINSLRNSTSQQIPLLQSSQKSESSNYFNQFNQPPLPPKDSPTQKKQSKVKPNHRTIEPLANIALDQEERQSPEQDGNSEEISKTPEKIKQSKPRIKQQENKDTKQHYQGRKSQPKPISKQEPVNKKVTSQHVQSQTEEDPQAARKRQNAILKYLKKARACGNLLLQKVEGRKKNPDLNPSGEDIQESVQP